MLTYITIRHRPVTVLRGYENAWQRPSRCDAWAMARHAGRGAYAIDVSACFPAPIVGLIFAVADAQSWRSEHFAPPRRRRRLRRPYRPRRLVGQRAAAAGERSAKVAEDAVTFLKDFALSSEMKVARRST